MPAQERRHMNHEPRLDYARGKRTTPRLRSGQANHGFTLIELITVIIIIGIMLGVALPKYMKMAEKTKASNAKRVLDILRKAEESYYAENSSYAIYAESDDSGTGIVDEIPQAKIDNDPDWDYGVPTASGDTFTATANRRRGANDLIHKTISLNNNGDFTYCDVNVIGCSEADEDSTAKSNWK